MSTDNFSTSIAAIYAALAQFEDGVSEDSQGDLKAMFRQIRDIAESNLETPTAKLLDFTRSMPNYTDHVGRPNPETGLVEFDPAEKDIIEYGLDALCAYAHGSSLNAGWYSDPKTGKRIDRNVPEMIALMHSELSEGLEGCRKLTMDDHIPYRASIEVELADCVIRIADTCGYLGLDLAGAVLDKMEYNRHRPDHKLENRALEGGKAF